MMPDEPIEEPRGSLPDGVPPTEDSDDPLPPEDQPAEQERRLDELAFLERSLTDLDAEREAGDISDADYRSLTGLYRERAAAVRRRATGHGPGERTPRRWRRLLAVLVTVALLGTGVGVGLASALGHRSSSDTITGDIRQSSRGMLFEAQELMATGHFDEAEELYAAVVAAEPSSAEALAWWGWLHFQRGDLEAAAVRIGEAVTSDPFYPDARVFGAIVAFRLGYLDAAAVHLDAFDAVDPPPLMVELVENSELRQRILAGRLVAAEAAGDSAATAALLAASSPGEMVVAAHHLAAGGEVPLATRLFSAPYWRSIPPTWRRWWAAALCSRRRTSPPSRTFLPTVSKRWTGPWSWPPTIRRPASGGGWPPPGRAASTTPWPIWSTWRHWTPPRAC